MRLNKYLAQSGVASRRRADDLIKAATVMVNGKLVLDPATDIGPDDSVTFDGQAISIEQNTDFILLNKPKGVITTARDEKGRKTVLDIVPHQGRLFPVGRLDRDTTGLVLLTNDGELANRLAHPRWRIPRLYEAVFDRPFTKDEIGRLATGIYIGENEFGKAEVVEQKTVKTRTTAVLRLRRGKKREIRRLFYHLKRKLFTLRRTDFGPLKLAGLPIGHWRHLSAEEIAQLKGNLNGH